MNTKKLTAVFLAVLTVMAMLVSCVEIDFPEDSSAESVQSKEETSITTTTEETSEQPVIDETSEEKGPLVYKPIWPESYDERVAYYSNMTMAADVYDNYFNDSVFVGNSIMLHYRNYVTDKRSSVSNFMGNANFFASASFSMYNNKNQKATDDDCVWPSFRGEKMTVEAAVKAMGVKTVYLSLMALNDIALYSDGMKGVEETYKLCVEMIENLKNDNPDINIVVLSNTYLYKGSNGMKKLNNGSISTLNVRVLDYCNDNGIDFVDIATVLLDNDKCLASEFCSDKDSSTAACHLTKYAYNAWTEILRDYAKKKSNGEWVNPTEMEGLSAN